MKKLFLLSAILLAFVQLFYAQSDVQALRWALQGKEINFNTNPPTVSNLTTGTVNHAINSYTYSDGEMLFQIVDNEIKDHNGNVLLTYHGAEHMGPEIIVMEEKNSCETYY